MPASCMIVNLNTDTIEKYLIDKAKLSINKYSFFTVSTHETKNMFCAISYTNHCCIRENRIFSDGITIVFSGQIVDYQSLPWEEIAQALDSGDYTFFASLNAPFAITAYSPEKREVFLVSDRCSQYSLYYTLNNGYFISSTNYATFFDCLTTKRVDKKWITDFFLFNYPISEITPIEGVHRMPAASVIRINTESLNISMQTYAPMYFAKIPEYSDNEMKEFTYEVFKERFPRYYTGLSSNNYFASITSGFDARVSTAFKPDSVNLTLYTYGIKESLDMREGEEIARILDHPHIPFYIDENILSDLLQLSHQTVDDSGGMLNILRATLAFVYKQLASNGAELVITGIDGDHFFRGAGVAPHVMSEIAVALINDPTYIPKEHPYLTIFNDNREALEHFSLAVEFLEKQFSWSSLAAVERRMMLYHYKMSPKHYGGELSFAENYLSLASPFWDNKIRELSYKNTLSTLTWLSPTYSYPPSSKRNSLFTYILLKHPKLQNIPIHGLKPKYYAAGNHVYYRFGQVLNRIPAKIRHIFGLSGELELERWDKWFGKYVLAESLKKEEPFLIYEYISRDTVQKIFEAELSPASLGAAYHLCARILNMEFILRKFMA